MRLKQMVSCRVLLVGLLVGPHLGCDGVERVAVQDDPIDTLRFSEVPDFVLGTPLTENPAEIYAQLHSATLFQSDVVYSNAQGEVVRLGVDGTFRWRVGGFGTGPEAFFEPVNLRSFRDRLVGDGYAGSLVILAEDGTILSRRGMGIASRHMVPAGRPAASPVSTPDGVSFYITLPNSTIDSRETLADWRQGLVRQVGRAGEVVTDFDPVVVTRFESRPGGNSVSYHGTQRVALRNGLLWHSRDDSPSIQITDLDLTPVAEIEAPGAAVEVVVDVCSRAWVRYRAGEDDYRMATYADSGDLLFAVDGLRRPPIDADSTYALSIVRNREYHHSVMEIRRADLLKSGCRGD